MTAYTKLQYTLLSALLFLVSTSFAQTNKKAVFDEGYITYEIQVIGMPEIEEFLKETTLTLYVKDDKTKMDLRIMGGFAQMQLVSNFYNDLHTVLMDLPMLPNKISIPLVGDDDILERLDSKVHTNHSPKDFGTIAHFEQDVKKIAKQPCYRAELPIAGEDNFALMYLAKKIKSAYSIKLFEQVGITDAIPLALNICIDDIHVYLIAKEVKKVKIDDAIFEVTEEYNQQTFKELRRSIEEVFGSTKKEGVGL